MRTEFSRKVRSAVLPDALGGEPTLENCAVLCTNCHGEKTAKVDVPTIAKSNRVRDAHRAAIKRRSRFAGSRDSRLKKKLDGTVVDRITGEPV
jgi:5-methylcytosine-specific restriction enzyme A